MRRIVHSQVTTIQIVSAEFIWAEAAEAEESPAAAGRKRKIGARTQKAASPRISKRRKKTVEISHQEKK